MKQDPNLGLTHEQFVKRLIKSQEAVMFLKEYLEKKNLKVTVPELRIAPNQEERGNYSDEVDLYFINKKGKRCNVEVKQTSLSFTTESFPYPTMIVNSLLGFDNKKIKPDIHFILSKDREYAALVKIRTLNKWKTRRIYDRIKKQNLWFYIIPTEYVNFIKLEKK